MRTTAHGHSHRQESLHGRGTRDLRQTLRWSEDAQATLLRPRLPDWVEQDLSDSERSCNYFVRVFAGTTEEFCPFVSWSPYLGKATRLPISGPEGLARGSSAGTQTVLALSVHNSSTRQRPLVLPVCQGVLPRLLAAVSTLAAGLREKSQHSHGLQVLRYPTRGASGLAGRSNRSYGRRSVDIQHSLQPSLHTSCTSTLPFTSPLTSGPPSFTRTTLRL